MTPSEYWKNFDLGHELDIAGTFIYDSVSTFHEMEHFHHRSEIFSFLYNASVGIERLQKIVLILIEHDTITDQEEFEKSLITHSHQDLDRRLRTHGQKNHAPIDNAFLALLSNFYKSHRYGRYSQSGTGLKDRERELWASFLAKHLSIEVDFEAMVVSVSNDEKAKQAVGKILKRICIPLYERLQTEAHRLNLYTYELRTDSKAFRIFFSEKFNLLDDDFVRLEILLYLIHQKTPGSNVKLIMNHEPLELDGGMEGEYINALLGHLKAFEHKDEISCIYEDADFNIKDRLQMLSAVRSMRLYLQDEEDPFGDEF